MTPTGFYSVDSLRGFHVLVVDDERCCRELLRAILEYCGALVTVVATADEALEVMKRVKPDVLIIDVAMPEKDGYWLLRAVRALKPEDGGTVPAVALTTREHREDRERGASVGFSAYLPKPFNSWELCRTVSDLTMSN